MTLNELASVYNFHDGGILSISKAAETIVVYFELAVHLQYPDFLSRFPEIKNSDTIVVGVKFKEYSQFRTILVRQNGKHQFKEETTTPP